MPVERAGGRIIFADGPEGHVIGGIDRGHAIIAPAAVGARLAASAAEQRSFALAKVTWRVGGKTSRITNAWERC